MSPKQSLTHDAPPVSKPRNPDTEPDPRVWRGVFAPVYHRRVLFTIRVPLENVSSTPGDALADARQGRP